MLLETCCVLMYPRSSVVTLEFNYRGMCCYLATIRLTICCCRLQISLHGPEYQRFKFKLRYSTLTTLHTRTDRLTRCACLCCLSADAPTQCNVADRLISHHVRVYETDILQAKIHRRIKKLHFLFIQPTCAHTVHTAVQLISSYMFRQPPAIIREYTYHYI